MELHLTGPGLNIHISSFGDPLFFACCCECSSGSSCILSRCSASSGPLGIPSCPLCPSLVLIKIMLNWGFAENQIPWQSNSRKEENHPLWWGRPDCEAGGCVLSVFRKQKEENASSDWAHFLLFAQSRIPAYGMVLPIVEVGPDRHAQRSPWTLYVVVCPEVVSASRSCQIDHINHHGDLVLVL